MNGRRLLALTVDHGLSPDSAAWTGFARNAARQAGADWRGLSWTGPKPTSGLTAAARSARHRLIADAAREAGARVALFAHTADDIAESEVMRAEGSTLGRLRDWSPSPAWPEGRGLMLLRPMLGAGRMEVRNWLAGQGAAWIDDPANEDPGYARSRARASLLRGDGGRPHREAPLALARQNDSSAAVRANPRPSGAGAITIDRTTDAHALAAALVCVGGGARLPRKDRLDGLRARLARGDDFAATLCGARVEALGDQVRLTREAGEFARRPPPPLPMAAGVETVWDGRWAVTVDAPGWSVVPAAGRMGALSVSDRALLKALPPAARGSIPVLIRHDATAPVLAGTAGKATSLVEERLARALDRMTHERDPGDVLHGASPSKHLFSGAQITDDRALRRDQGPRRE